MPRALEATPTWLRTGTILQADKPRVDRENNVILGYIVAEKGPFKSQGRGEFDDEGLDMIVAKMLGNSKGTKSRYTHPGLSSDGLGKFLGRSHNPRRDGPRVRADLHIDPSSRNTPSGDLGGYVMDLAENDPEAFGSSLVLTVDQKYRLDEKGHRLQDEQGNDLPPLWYPKKIHASDVVDEGDAVHSGFLSTATIDFDKLPDAELRQGFVLLDSAFPGQPREVVESRLNAFLLRYLDQRYGPTPLPPGLSRDMRERILREKEIDNEMSDGNLV